MSHSKRAQAARAILQARLRAAKDHDQAFRDRAVAAERLGVARDTLGRYERGVSDVPRAVLSRMVDVYKMSDQDALALLKSKGAVEAAAV